MFQIKGAFEFVPLLMMMVKGTTRTMTVMTSAMKMAFFLSIFLPLASCGNATTFYVIKNV